MKENVKDYVIDNHHGYCDFNTGKYIVTITKGYEVSRFLLDSKYLQEDFIDFVTDVITETNDFNLLKFTKDMDGTHRYTFPVSIPNTHYGSKPKQVMGANGPYWI